MFSLRKGYEGEKAAAPCRQRATVSQGERIAFLRRQAPKTHVQLVAVKVLKLNLSSQFSKNLLKNCHFEK
jgi:hypothetical protein